MEFSIIIILVLAIALFLAGSSIVKSGSYANKLKKISNLYNEGNLEATMKEINELDPKHKKETFIQWIAANIYYKQQQYINISK